MSNLKELRSHKKSISSIHKLTLAMKMVSNAKFTRHQAQWRESVYCLTRMKEMAERLYTQADLYECCPFYLQPCTEDLPFLLVVFASDKGLCGGFNLRLFKAAQQIIQEKQGPDHPVQLICIGQKAVQFFSSYPGVIATYPHGIDMVKDFPSFVTLISSLYQNKTICECLFLYNSFHNALKQEPHCMPLLPMHLDPHPEADRIEEGLLDYDPSFEVVFEEALDMLLRTQIFSIIKEHSVSEHSARMAAMEIATDNAEDMIAKLNLEYNRLRQSLITTQLTEIIAGAEAL